MFLDRVTSANSFGSLITLEVSDIACAIEFDYLFGFGFSLGGLFYFVEKIAVFLLKVFRFL